MFLGFNLPNSLMATPARLSNEKPSAIFRVRGSFEAAQTSQASQQLIVASSQASGTTAQLGIAIETIDAVMAQISTLPPPANKAIGDPATIAEQVGKHLVNYLSGFAETVPGTGQMYVPMNAVNRWYESFMNKIKARGAGFLERQE
jgi:protein Hikeshi